MVSTPLSLRSISRFYLYAASVLPFAVVALAPTVAGAQAFTLLYSFRGGFGEYPLAAVIVDSRGNTYGTTSEGGAHGLGTVFKVTASGSETVLHSFKGGRSDGNFPIAALVRDAAGNLYGTTAEGGTAGYGTVFKVGENGDETLLHSFGESEKDGKYPAAGLLLGPKGNLYGTTQEGGASGYGTIFEVDENSNETVLHSFAGYPRDGQYPVAGLIQDAEGNLYGTTEIGGTFNDGTVFKLDKERNETVLFSFTGMAGGSYPFGGVVRDSTGNLYGTTAYGSNEFGVVFKLDAVGREMVLHTFSGGADGGFPSAALVLDSKGILYGTTEFGGVNGAGAVFSITEDGKETVLHSFDGADGADLLTSLALDKAGNIYGTATEGGAHGQGSVFKLQR